MDAIERLRQKAQNERTVLALNEITRLQRDELSALKAQLAAAQEELVRLREENAKLREDAERYRWLRKESYDRNDFCL